MKCSICGKELKGHSIGGTCGGDCFTRLFWLTKESLYAEGKCVVIDGTCYYIGREDEPGSKEFRGYGGRKFFIKKNDGTVIETTNLSCNGAVPEKYREMFSDNAEFVDPTKI